MDINTRTAEQLAKDLAIAQEALRNIVTILRVETDDPQFHYEVGRAKGTAMMALALTGARS